MAAGSFDGTPGYFIRKVKKFLKNGKKFKFDFQKTFFFCKKKVVAALAEKTSEPQFLD